MNELNLKLNETTEYYENIIKAQNEDFKQNLLNEEQEQNRLKKELERLREHLVEMSDNYTKEAIHAEDREKQLRLALSNAQQMILKYQQTIKEQALNIHTLQNEIKNCLV